MIIGTAGHIDHGKSALVTALTGTPVDRLAEERRRGITIELNFAPLHFDGLPPAGIVDVPGHEDFVRTMVAGATGIDLVLLVVDLAEGPRPQTEEHLAIVEHLGIPRGIPVFTKADLVDADWADLVVDDVMRRLSSSPVRFGPPAVVSAVSGQGIPELRHRLREAVAGAETVSAADLFRLPIDRVFSMAGVGTVVTGTTWSGTVRIGDTVRILPPGLSARVRSIEAYGASVDAAQPHTRTALGLAGVEREAIARGHVVVDAATPWRATTGFDAEVHLLAGAARPLVQRTRVRLHVGTAELLARAHPRGSLAPGDRGLVRFALETPAVVRGSDRFILRSYSPVTTLGGGRVLDPWPPRRAGWPAGLDAHDPGERVAALVARRPAGLPREEAALALGLPPAEARAAVAAAPAVIDLGGGLHPAAEIDRLEGRILELLRAHHSAHPAEPGPSLETLRKSLRVPAALADAVMQRLEQGGGIRARGGLVGLSSFEPAFEGGDAAVTGLIERIAAAGLEPPTVGELAPASGVAPLGPLLRRAVETGAIVAVERDRYFAAAALSRFREALVDLGREGPITPATIRDRLGLSRKYSIPLLEWADRQGLTRRQGDSRVLVPSDR